MKARMLRKMRASNKAPEDKVHTDERGGRWLESGTVVEGPDVWQLVMHGCAIAEDDECKEAVAANVPQGTVGKLMEAHSRLMEQHAEAVGDMADDDEDDDE